MVHIGRAHMFLHHVTKKIKKQVCLVEVVGIVAQIGNSAIK